MPADPSETEAERLAASSTSSSSSPAAPGSGDAARTLDASRATYEAQARPSDKQLPGWDTISVNTSMRRAVRALDRLEHQLETT